MSLSRNLFGPWQREQVVVEVVPTTPAPVAVVPVTTPAVPAPAAQKRGQRQAKLSEIISRRTSPTTPQPSVEIQPVAEPAIRIEPRYSQNPFGTWVSFDKPVFRAWRTPMEDSTKDVDTPPSTHVPEISFPDTPAVPTSKPDKERVQSRLPGRASRYAPMAQAQAPKPLTTIDGSAITSTATVLPPGQA